MSNEIKEILDKLKNKDNDIKGINFLKYQDLTRGEINLLLDYITNLQQENFNLRENILIHKMSFKSDDKSLEHLINMPSYEDLQQENDKLNRQIIIMEKYFKLICDIGFDYDGYSDKVHLKKLIDELVRFASLGRACNDTEGIYIDNDNIYYNILNEKIERGGESEKDKN